MPSVSVSKALHELHAILDDEIGTLSESLRIPILVCYVASVLISAVVLHDAPAIAAPPAPKAANNSPESRVDADGVPLPEGALARVGTTRLRHGNILNEIAFSPDGSTLASIGQPGSIALWETSTGKLKFRLDLPGEARFSSAIRILSDQTVVAIVEDALYRIGPNAEIQATIRTRPDFKIGSKPINVAISPDGKSFAIARGDRIVHAHDAVTGQEIWQESIAPNYPRDLTYSPDGKTLALATGTSTTRLLDALSGKPVGELDSGQTTTWSVEFSPDGRALATDSAQSNLLTIWDLPSRTARVQKKLGTYFGKSVAFSHDGKYVAVSGLDRKVKLMRAADGVIVRSMPNQSMPRSLAFSPNGKILACASVAGFISFLDVETGKILMSADPSTDVFATRFTADGTKLAFASDQIYVRDWKSGSIVSQFDAQAGSPWTWDISSDCKMAAFADDAGAVHVVEMPAGKERFRFAASGRSPHQAIFSRGGSRLFIANMDALIEIVDVATGKLLQRLENKLKTNTRVSIAASDDGQLLAVATSGARNGRSDSEIHLWNLSSGAEVRRINPGHAFVFAMAFSPDRSMLAMGCGNYYVSGDEPGPVEIWDCKSGKKIRGFEGHNWGVHCVAFSPDGRTLAAGGQDNTVRLWEVGSGVERRRIVGHRSTIMSLAFSPDGGKLVSASLDAPIYVWDVYAAPGQAVKRSENEWWDCLQSASAHLGAIGGMIRNPDMAIAMCRARIKRVAKPDEKRVHQLMNDLSDPNFRVREKAESDLLKLGDVIEPIVRRELALSRSAESSARLKRLLSQFATPSGEQLAALRAMEAVEHIGSADARGLLQDWAGGDPDSSFTRAAKQSLERMKAR